MRVSSNARGAQCTLIRTYRIPKHVALQVFVYCVNDAAVMQFWAKDQRIANSGITFLADTGGQLTRALDMVLDAPGYSKCQWRAVHIWMH